MRLLQTPFPLVHHFVLARITVKFLFYFFIISKILPIWTFYNQDVVTKQQHLSCWFKGEKRRTQITFAVFKELNGYKLSDSGSSLSIGQSIGTNYCVVKPTSFIWFLVHIPVEWDILNLGELRVNIYGKKLLNISFHKGSTQNKNKNNPSTEC